LAKAKLWGGRFTAEEDPLFAEFNDSLPFDRELIEEDIEGSLAYARGLERAGVFSPKEKREVEKALLNLLAAHRRNPARVARSRAEDVHSFVEEELRKHIGPLALKLHTGRSRNDQVATDLRLYLRKKEIAVEQEIDALLEIIAAAAKRHAAVLMPGYTHLQRAQPILFSHYLMAYGEMLLRDRQRLREAKERMNISPLGSGALSGTIYNVDRGLLAQDLGFHGESANSLDSVSDRDFVLDFLYFASTLLMHLSRLAEDLILYSSAEFGFIQLHDSVASGSSLMPQKKNPDALELIRGKTGRVFGHLLSLLTVLKGLPMTYNKDLQEDKEGLFDAVRTVLACLRMAAKVLATMKINPERMRQAAGQGYLNATELADYLVAKQVPFRSAHHIIGRIVVRALELGLTLEQLPLEEYRGFSSLFEKDLYECLKLESAVARRVGTGGTAPGSVQAAVKLLRKRIRSRT
jgi:argininosuccinate lyase